MTVQKNLIRLIEKSPFLDKVYSRFRSITSVLWGYGTHETYLPELIQFLAQKRGINELEAKILVEKADKQFKGGWGGNDYRRFTDLALETFRPFYDDITDKQVIETYQFHGLFDFLRMSAYSVPTAEDMEPIIGRLVGKNEVTIVDYGCGLAHRSISVSKFLIIKGIKVKLFLVDIRREMHFSFLDFLCKKYGIENHFIEITPDNLYPELPSCDYCDNVSVLEHIREPLTVINNTDRALKPGGLFLVLALDAIEEMMHITPNLRVTRERLRELRYQKVDSCYGTPLFQKPLS